jgi:hypothetical protein
MFGSTAVQLAFLLLMVFNSAGGPSWLAMKATLNTGPAAEVDMMDGGSATAMQFE